MQIDRIFYPVKTLGYGSRIGIWTIGCPHACYNCSNPDLWEGQSEKDIAVDKLLEIFHLVKKPIDGLTISGGEPFEQPEELYELVKNFSKDFTQDILIYSGYTIEQLRNMNKAAIDGILNTIAVLIDGKYVETLNDNLPLRGSSNQRIHFLNDFYRERYSLLLDGTRTVQTILNQAELFTIGIPVKGYKDYFETNLNNQYGIQLKTTKET